LGESCKTHQDCIYGQFCDDATVETKPFLREKFESYIKVPLSAWMITLSRCIPGIFIAEP
jgi:hypothetical protein